MIVFPNCKINLGLHVLRKRPDGYHDLETVMLPVRGLCDALEIIPDTGDDVIFSTSGLAVDGNQENNLCVKAYRLMQKRYGIGGVKMHLHKHIPFGAGLGGGSSDAVFALKLLNDTFGLNLPAAELESLAAELGSDTAFFVRNRPALAQGRGEVLSPVDIDLSGHWLMIVKPPFSVGTAEAYRGVIPTIPEKNLSTVLKEDISTWKRELKNDFEASVFPVYPELAEIKDTLYNKGAVYASLSGSGSALFGLFREEPKTGYWPDSYFVHVENML